MPVQNSITIKQKQLSEIFSYKKPFTLESGITLPGFHLAYTTYGQLNDKKDNVIWVFHALTANSDAEEWWPGLVGDGKLFDPKESFIICANIPGSCYGSIGPLDINIQTSEPFYHSFPFFTTRDMIRSYQQLRESLGITKIQVGIGGSMGGQQLVEWAVEEPELFENIIPVATNAFHSPWGIGFNSSQRLAIEADETWKQTDAQAGINGMKAARSIALLSYRNYETYQFSQAEITSDKLTDFKSESYQRYQGEKLAKRFNAFSYYFLSKSMDAHNVGRNRGGSEIALQRIKANTLVISISSDLLFPPSEQQFLAAQIPGAIYKSIESIYGHDGFLLEFEQLTVVIREFLSIATNESQIK